MLKQISDAGFTVAVAPSIPPEPDGFQVTATEITTGVVTRVTDASLVAATTRLADQLGVYCKLTNEPVFLGYRAPLPLESLRVFPVVALLGLTASIFLLDVATPGLNLGVLYVIPLILARRSSLSRRELLLYTAILMCLTFADHVVNQLTASRLPPEPAELFNRSLAMDMIAATCGFTLLYRGRSPYAQYLIDKSPQPFSILPPQSSGLKDLMADRLTALLSWIHLCGRHCLPQPLT